MDAWELLKKAAIERDVDDVKFAIQTYVKAAPETTFPALEESFRNQNIGIYLIAVNKELIATLTNMDLQGRLEQEYTISYRFSPKPERPRERENWASPEENKERLANAGDVVARGVPQCHNCNQLGHTTKACPEERRELDTVRIKCYNCDGEGHRVRDCKYPCPLLPFIHSFLAFLFLSLTYT
jgi:hypothetical protein